MDFLFKDRGSGKRAIKPSKEAEVLDALIPDHESDDSDFELDKHRGGGGDSDDNDTDDDKSNSEGSDEDSDSEAGGDSDTESVDEDEVLRLKSNLTTEELISLAKRQTQANASAGCSVTSEVGTIWQFFLSKLLLFLYRKILVILSAKSKRNTQISK